MGPPMSDMRIWMGTSPAELVSRAIASRLDGSGVADPADTEQFRPTAQVATWCCAYKQGGSETKAMSSEVSRSFCIGTFPRPGRRDELRNVSIDEAKRGI